MTVHETARHAPPSGYSANADFWVRVIRGCLDTYRIELTDEAILAAVDPRPGETILDAGCGEGWLSRACVERGAQVVGIDLCPELVAAARRCENGSQPPPSYEIADVRQLPLAAASVDVVVCNHVLNDVPDPDNAIAEFGRVLRPGGRLVVMLLHPCFYTAQAERVEHAPSLQADDYFRLRVVRQPFRIAGVTSPAETTSHVYPLEFYFAAFGTAGLAVTALSEPHPSAEVIARNPWWKENFRRPLFLLITATGRPAT